MTRQILAAVATAAITLLAYAGQVPVAAADRPSLAGRWTINFDLSQFPPDMGFGMDLVAGASGSDNGVGGGGLASSVGFRESEEEAKRREQLVDEANNPSPHLTIAQTDTTVTITDERGRSRTFHTDGREEAQKLDQVPVATTARWDRAELQITYKVELRRELRYTYSRTSTPARLVVQVQFIERGGGGPVTRIYEPTRPNEPPLPERKTAKVPPVKAAAPSAPPRMADPFKREPAQPSAPGAPQGQPPAPAQAPAQAPSPAQAPAAAQGPDAALKGLVEVGVVVEDLGSQAAACGLSQAPIEAAVAKSLVDAGLKVRRNSDEDTYVYVRIITTSASPTLCVSRYDAYLYSYTTATLPYQASSALLQVELLHDGGIAGSAPGAHGDAVLKSIKQYVDGFAARIRAANK